MRNFNWSALLGSLLAIFLPSQTPPQPPVDSPAINPNITWTILLSQAAPPAGAPPGGSRGPGDEIVPLLPGSISTETWSNRPLFLWQGVARQIELIAANGSIVWNQRLAETARHCFYTDTPLPSGTYEWILYSPAKVAVSRVAFRVMSPEKQARITADLAALETQLSTASAEHIALQKANYFAERQLWSDVFREAFSVAHPSKELSALLESLPTTLIG
jgi:hypothetical protein